MVGGAKPGLSITCPGSPPEDSTKISVESQRTDVGVQLCNSVEQLCVPSLASPLSTILENSWSLRGRRDWGVPEMELGCWEEPISESSLDVV